MIRAKEADTNSRKESEKNLMDFNLANHVQTLAWDKSVTPRPREETWFQRFRVSRRGVSEGSGVISTDSERERIPSTQVLFSCMEY